MWISSWLCGSSSFSDLLPRQCSQISGGSVSDMELFIMNIVKTSSSMGFRSFCALLLAIADGNSEILM